MWRTTSLEDRLAHSHSKFLVTARHMFLPPASSGRMLEGICSSSSNTERQLRWEDRMPSTTLAEDQALQANALRCVRAWRW